MKRVVLILAAIAAVVFGVVYNYSFDEKLDLNGDNATYIQLARNQSQGIGYSTVGIDGVKPASHFPPAYSTFLSLFMRLGIDNLIFFKVVNGLLLFASLLLLGFAVAKITRQTYLAFAAVVLAMFSPQLLHFAGIVMSEMFYLFMTALCFFSLYKYDSRASSRFWKSPWFYIAIVAAALAYYTRTVGASIIAALIIFFLFRKEWWAALSAVVATVVLQLPWIVRNAVYGIEGRYLGTIMTVNPWRPEEGTISTFGELVGKMITNFDETVIKGFKEILFPFVELNYQEPSGLFAVIGGLLIVALVFWGAWNMGSLRWSMMLFILANIGLFALWHGGNGSRYVVPVAPYLFLTFYAGLFFAVQLLLKKKRLAEQSYIPLLCLVMLFPMLKPVQTQAAIAKSPTPPPYKNYYDIALAIDKKAPKGTVVCCRKPELFSYYAPKAFAVNYIYSQDPDAILADMIKKKVDFVVLEQLGFSSTPRYLLPAIEANMELFPMLWHLTNPDTYLLKFNRAEAEAKLANKHVETAVD